MDGQLMDGQDGSVCSKYYRYPAWTPADPVVDVDKKSGSLSNMLSIEWTLLTRKRFPIGIYSQGMKQLYQTEGITMVCIKQLSNINGQSWTVSL